MPDDVRPQMAEPRTDIVRMVANPFGSAERAGLPAAVGGLVAVEQNRAMAEVQAHMLVARSSPRNQIRCMDDILRDCTRPKLAEQALYQYSRGGTAISGPSIRLAEAIAQRWGHIRSGIKEIARGDGYSECVAYAWDIEAGYYDERQFQVRHWRDTKKGGYQLTDERDIYELIANMGQRRKRAALLTVIPGDVVEAAVDQCEATLKASIEATPDAIQKMVEAFTAFGVNKAQIEKRCQCRIEAIRPAQLVQLRKIYISLKDEMSSPEDWFEAVQLADAPTQQQRAPRQTKTAAKATEQPAATQTDTEAAGDAVGAGATASGEPAATDQDAASDQSSVMEQDQREQNGEARQTEASQQAKPAGQVAFEV